VALLKLVKLIEPDPSPFFGLTSVVRIPGSFFSYTLYTRQFHFATRGEKKSQDGGSRLRAEFFGR
jgi:hypothetical protein